MASNVTGGFERMKAESQSGLAMRKIQLGFLQRFDWGAIEKLQDTVRDYLRPSPEERMKAYPKDIAEETLQGLYEEESVYGEELADLTSELAIVALYKKLEIDTKRAIKIVFPEQSDRDLFKWETLKNFLRGQGIDIENFSKYSEVDELRIINNCIKHSGIVDGNLSKFGEWKKGEHVTSLDRHFHRLALAAERYMADLTNALSSKLK